MTQAAENKRPTAENTGESSETLPNSGNNDDFASEDSDSGGDWIMTYADLVTLLFAFFV